MKLLKKINHQYVRLMTGLLVLCCQGIAFADGIIPTTDADVPSSSKDFLTILLTIWQKEVAPIVEVAGAIMLLFAALGGLWKGYGDYQKEKDWSHIKQAVIASSLMIVVGGAILMLIDMTRTHPFNS